MGAAQDQSVDLLKPQRVQVAAQDHLGFTFVQPALFNQRHQQRAGPADYPAVRLDFLNTIFIHSRAHGRPGADNADSVVFCHCCSFLGCRRDHVDYRCLVLVAQGVGCSGSSGITGNDNNCGSVAEQEIRIAAGVVNNSFRTFRAVGGTGNVAKVKQRVSGADMLNCPGYSHAADTGIKNADHDNL